MIKGPPPKFHGTRDNLAALRALHFYKVPVADEASAWHAQLGHSNESRVSIRLDPTWPSVLHDTVLTPARRWKMRALFLVPGILLLLAVALILLQVLGR